MRKAVFLDRDGTINVEKGYLYRIKDFEYINGVVEALKQKKKMGYTLVIITNQSGIARGYYAEETFLSLTRWMVSDLQQKGIPVAGVYYCPHHPDGGVKKYAVACECRKPGTKLFWQAQEDLQVDMEHSYAIGDKMRDIAICWESGVQGIVLDEEESVSFCCNTKYSEKKPIWKCHNLYEAAKKIYETECNKKVL